ncbi:MAG: hypothetical protein MUE75_05410 [Algoriphagus sp.]|nr:hypothetical protein [Algoriphagus sp.]
MNLFPYHTETLVSPLSKEEVLGQLMRVTREVNFLDSRSYLNDQIKFNGIIGRNGFQISHVVKKGDTFLPLLIGKMEETPKGSIIFLEYKPFPSAIFFLVFWTLILISFSAYYLIISPTYSYFIVCSSLAILNYGLGLFFFNRQYKRTKAVFHELINFQLKDKD